MTLSVFTRSAGPSLAEFIVSVKAGKRDFFDVLQTPASSFIEASFSELMANEDDVLAGVNRVLVTNIWYFGVFHYCLVKYHDNGDVKFVFYDTVNDSSMLIRTVEALFAGIGQGIAHEEKGIPFTNKSALLELASGLTEGKENGLLQFWLMDDTAWLLQYKTVPLHEFSLMVTVCAPRKVDYSTRRKGTILDLLAFDIMAVMADEEIKNVEERQEGQLQFVDYTFKLEAWVLQAFNLATIRKWDGRKRFEKGAFTAITFYNSEQMTYEAKLSVLEALIRMYGTDNSGYGELGIGELEILEGNRFFTGRWWRFNQFNGLHQPDKEGEILSYEVRVDDFADETGFNVSISGYNELVSLFSVE
jgi:hypothetical protein